jgi:hypothetical protein
LGNGGLYGNLKPVAPDRKRGTVRKIRPPNRTVNDKLRGRWHLTEAEVSRLQKQAIKNNRNGFRDSTMVMTAYMRLSARINARKIGA